MKHKHLNIKKIRHNNIRCASFAMAVLVCLLCLGQSFLAADAEGIALKLGDRGEEVESMQDKLVKLGYLSDADGIFGPTTEKAVIAFQKAKDLTDDGVAGTKTLNALEKATASSGSALKKGDEGSEVTAMQKKLVKLGYLSSADGVFGSATEKAVIAFQRAKDLTDDGVAGTKTLNALEKAVSGSSDSDSSVLKKGSTGTAVKKLQNMLVALGYLSSSDGAFGPVTAKGVIAFQEDHDLTADGVVGSKTMSVLKEAYEKVAINDCLKKGDDNVQVRTLQRILNAQGYSCGTADGEFGDQTEDAVIEFQEDAGLTADGVVGSRTVSALDSTSTTKKATSTTKGQKVVAEAMKYLGIDYHWGKASPSDGFDCSGLVWYVYKQLGVSVPRSSSGLRGYGTKVSSIDEAKPGDILCWSGHAAIYIGDNKYIHAPQTGDVVKISTIRKQPLWIGRIFD